MISLSLDHHTHPTFTASALLTWPSLWSGLTDCVWVQVYAVPRGYYVSSHVDLRGRFDQWNVGRRAETLEEAAAIATDLWLEGVRLGLALARGEPLRPPNVLMREAWEASEEHARLDGTVRAARQAMFDLNVEAPGYEARRREAAEVKDQALATLKRGAEAWWAAQDWRAFRDLGHSDVKPETKPSVDVDKYRQPAAGQMALLDVA